jgi:N-acetylglutamate synthase-like GNAT family acetyltransferase
MLRPARATDSNQIRELIHLVGINPTGLDWRRFVVVVDPQGRLVGCGQIKPHGEGIHELASIAVHPDRRGQGIARAIIESLLADGSGPIFLMCRSQVGPLYEKFGFRELPYEAMPRYFQRISKLAGLAKVLMQAGDELLIMKLV